MKSHFRLAHCPAKVSYLYKTKKDIFLIMDDIQTEQDQNSPTIEPIRFRAGKKRKAYRQRAVEEGNDDVATISPAPVVPGVSSLKDVEAGRDADDIGAEAQNFLDGFSEKDDDDNDDNDGGEQTTGESAVAAALRLRNARRAARRGGVGFRSEGRSAGGHDEDDSEHALILRDQDKDAAHDRIVGGITNRFMHQTGLLTILDDQHMYVSQTSSGKGNFPLSLSLFPERQTNHSGMHT
jgi:hypothetical protein